MKVMPAEVLDLAESAFFCDAVDADTGSALSTDFATDSVWISLVTVPPIWDELHDTKGKHPSDDEQKFDRFKKCENTILLIYLASTLVVVDDDSLPIAM